MIEAPDEGRPKAVATRFEKHDAGYLALGKRAAARIWMRFTRR